MFSQACVKNSVRGACMAGGVHGGGGACVVGGMRGRGACVVGEMAIAAAVHILLECILI